MNTLLYSGLALAAAVAIYSADKPTNTVPTNVPPAWNLEVLPSGDTTHPVNFGSNTVWVGPGLTNYVGTNAYRTITADRKPVVTCDGTNWTITFDKNVKPVKDATPIELESVKARDRAQRDTQAFLLGARYGLLAISRNPDVHNSEILVEIAASLYQNDLARTNK